MNDAEADLVILRCCVESLHVDPGDPICPDLEAIANGDGTLFEKLDRVRIDLEDNIRERRAPT